MKTKRLLYGFAAIAVLVGIALFCESPQDPRTDPENAKIMGVSNFKDTAVVGLAYRCTVSLQLPELIDSIIIKKKSGALYVRSAVTAIDSLVDFGYGFTKTDIKKDTIMVIIIRKENAGNDTLLKPVVGIKPLHIKLLNKCHLNNNCALFDTIWADTCAYDLDSIIYPNHGASYLNWISSDTLRGNIYRLVKIYRTTCFTIPPNPPICFTSWIRRWVVEYDDTYMHLCAQTGLDTIWWYVEDDSSNIDIQPLILKRSATCP